MNPALLKLSFFGLGPSGRKLTGLVVCLLFAQVVMAQTYVNNQNASYVVPGNPPPQINATAFDNENIFSVTYNNIINNQILYCEPWWGTLFFTNNAQMSVSGAADSLNGGIGFEFDLQQTSSNQTNMLADTFYNPGVIDCNSLLNFAPGGCIIQATNVIVPGTIAIGSGGSLAVNGQNVNLSRSVISMEAAVLQFVSGGIQSVPAAPFTGTGESGTYTNAWDPAADLLQTTATSAAFPLFPITGFELFNSLPYNQQTGSNLNRSAFVENDSPPNVTYNVYFGATSVSNFIGGGDLTVEFVATYLNFATGQLVTNHLYLNDDYVAGAVTNVLIGPGGWPDNFVLTQSATPLVTNTPYPINLPAFPLGEITNNPYVYAEFLGNGVGSTNISTVNPGGSITNLPGQVRIVATRELNLNFAQITDPEYLSLTATNQFDGSAGAQMDPLFSDFNLGNTNNSITISNLIEPQIPDWNGTIQAWSTRWFNEVSNIIVTVTSTNTTTNVVVSTNDWRTCLVDANLNPTTVPQIRNLTLNATNSLVISDVLNIYGSLYANAQSLTLTTNAIGTGAASPDGELNLQNQNPTGWSWTGSFPNLLWVTNNGAIRLPNFAQFIGTSSSNLITASTPATFATATLSEGTGTNVQLSSTVTIGTATYTFTNSSYRITKTSPPYIVRMGTNFDDSLTNLIAAINFGAGSNVVYSTNQTYPNGFVTAGKLVNHAFTVTSIYIGTNGNIIPIGTTATNLTWNPADLLAGGTNAMASTTNLVAVQIPYGAIINNGLLSDQGSSISVNNFQNEGVVDSGSGSFVMDASTAELYNGELFAGGDVSITSTSLTTTNLLLQAGRSLTLNVSNTLTDNTVLNANTWIVGSPNGTGANGNGLELPIKPEKGDLLGTAIYLPAMAPSQKISSTWAASDLGASTSGFNNNVAIGQLILDALGPQSQLEFSGTGSDNAIYVGQLVLNDYASTVTAVNSNLPAILINTNFVIYYGDAIASTSVTGGPFVDVSSQLNGFNTNRFRWVQSFSGLFNSLNVGIPAAFTSEVSLPPSPAINGSSYGNGKFLLAVSGTTLPVTVQASTNLVDWVNLFTNSPPFTFTDKVTSLPYRFYRAEVP